MTLPALQTDTNMSALEMWLGVLRQQCANEGVDYWEVGEEFWLGCARGEMTPGEALAVGFQRN